MIHKLSDKDKKVFSFIRNKIIHYGKSPSLREINELTGGKSPRSASLIIDRLQDAELILRKGRELLLMNTTARITSTQTVDVPLVGSVSCGSPLFAEENIEAQIQVSTALAKSGSRYFLLRASGDSMNQAGINSGDLLLVRQQSSAENNEKVVALINDEATVKFFEKKGNHIVLRPKSSNKEHKPIIVTDNLMIQGVVEDVLPVDIY